MTGRSPAPRPRAVAGDLSTALLRQRAQAVSVRRLTARIAANLDLDAALNESDVPQVAVAPEAPTVGDALNIGIETPGFPSYLYATYFSADGKVMNIAQPDSSDLRPKAGHTIVRFGDAQSGQVSLTVSPPVEPGSQVTVRYRVSSHLVLAAANSNPLDGNWIFKPHAQGVADPHSRASNKEPE